MWLFVILELVILLTFVVLLFLGPTLMAIGKYRKNKKQLRLGFRLFMVPLVITVSILMHHMLWKLFIKPDEKDLIGHYQLARPSNSAVEGTRLNLYENGTYEKSYSIINDSREKGKYQLDDDEIWFNHDSHATAAKIEKSVFDYKIKFIVGCNPNNKDNIVFEKVSD